MSGDYCSRISRSKSARISLQFWEAGLRSLWPADSPFGCGDYRPRPDKKTNDAAVSDLFMKKSLRGDNRRSLSFVDLSFSSEEGLHGVEEIRRHKAPHC